MEARRIDIYVRIAKGSDAFRYVCTTQRCSTCKEAKERFLEANPRLTRDDVQTQFA